MRKFLFGAVLLAIPFFPVEIPAIPEIAPNSSFATYSDSEYTKEEVNFAPGQAVYVEAETASSQEATVLLTLLNEAKIEIAQLSTSKRGQNYYGQFSAPQDPGTYYVHIEIKGEGLAFSGERNINVGGSSSEQSISGVNVKAESVADTSEEGQGEETDTLSKPELAAEETKLFSLLNWIKNLLSRILKLL